MPSRRSPTTISNENIEEREANMREREDNNGNNNTHNNNKNANYPNVANNDNDNGNDGNGGPKIAYPKVINAEKKAAMEKRRNAERNAESIARQKKMNNNAAEERQKRARNKARELAKRATQNKSKNETNLAEKTVHKRKTPLKAQNKEGKMGNVLSEIDRDLSKIAAKLQKNRGLITVKNQEKLDRISNYLRLKNSNIEKMKPKEQKAIKPRANEMKTLTKTIKKEVDEIMEEKFIEGMRNRIKSLNNSITNNKEADKESKELWRRLRELNLTAASREDIEDWFGISANELENKIKEAGLKRPKASKTVRTAEKMLANTDYVMFPKELLDTLTKMKVRNNTQESPQLIAK